MARAGKKKEASRRRFVYLLLFLAAAGAVFFGRREFLWGLKGYVLDEIEFLRIQSQSDLPPRSEAGPRPAEVVGIPDYKNALRFPYKGKILTCYRMVDFGNRLCVCTGKGLASPKAIDEIIKDRTIRGRLESLKRSPLDESLRRVFLKFGGIPVEEDAFLLYEDPSPLPSAWRVCLLSLCLLLSCFFAFRLIRG
jgi:hypothetical protein